VTRIGPLGDPRFTIAELKRRYAKKRRQPGTSQPFAARVTDVHPEHQRFWESRTLEVHHIIEKSDQDILLLSADMARFLGACATGPDGRFTCALPARATPETVVVMANVKASAVTVLYQAIGVPQAAPVEFRVDSHKKFLTVTGSVDTAAGWPPLLNLFLNPVMIDGVPERLQRFFNQKARRGRRSLHRDDDPGTSLRLPGRARRLCHRRRLPQL
jgi:hypothetical protein